MSKKRFIFSPERIDVVVSLIFGYRLLLLIRRALVRVHDVGHLVETWDRFKKIYLIEFFFHHLLVGDPKSRIKHNLANLIALKYNTESGDPKRTAHGPKVGRYLPVEKHSFRGPTENTLTNVIFLHLHDTKPTF